jgi:hypothetical protein
MLLCLFCTYIRLLFFCRIYLSASFFCVSPSFSRFPTHSSPLHRFFFFHFIPLYIFIFSFRTHLLSPAASGFFHILRPIHPHVPVLLSTLYPRLHRTIALSVLGGGGVGWQLLGQSFIRPDSKSRSYELPVIVMHSAVCLTNVHRSELQIETSLLWKWIARFPQKLPACIHTNIVLQCAV